MSFVDKIKGWGQRGSDTEQATIDGDVAVADDYRPARVSAARAAISVLPGDSQSAAAFDAMPQAGDGAPQPSSIISEAVPSGIADFTETRLQGSDTGAAPLGSALPLIGDRPAAEQQRILLALLGVGLLGLIVLDHPVVRLGGRGSAQVAASGQALMQSQRLAKSVSQALTGNRRRFPKSRRAPRCSRQRAQPEDRRRRVAAAPSGVQDASTGAAAGRPRREERRHRDRPAEGADRGRPVAARDQPPVGRPARDVGGDPVAEAAARLHPTEVSALGQLVMLTQRIGKSANEFLTAEGVNPEAVVLLSKDLNSFNEITKGLLDGNPQMGLPGTRDAQVRERLIALNKQYQETRRAARDSRQPAAA